MATILFMWPINRVSEIADDPPTLSTTPNLTATIGSDYAYQLIAEDVDFGDQLTFSLLSGPAWLSMTQLNNKIAVLNGTPLATDLGEHDVVLEVRDSGDQSLVQTFTLQVVEDGASTESSSFLYLPFNTKP